MRTDRLGAVVLATAGGPTTGAVYVTGSSNADRGPGYATVAYRD